MFSWVISLFCRKWCQNKAEGGAKRVGVQQLDYVRRKCFLYGSGFIRGTGRVCFFCLQWSLLSRQREMMTCCKRSGQDIRPMLYLRFICRATRKPEDSFIKQQLFKAQFLSVWSADELLSVCNLQPWHREKEGLLGFFVFNSLDQNITSSWNL